MNKKLSIEAGVFLMIFLFALGGFASLYVENNSGNELSGELKWKGGQNLIDKLRNKQPSQQQPIPQLTKQMVISPTITQQKGHILVISSQSETKIVLDKNEKSYFMTPKNPNGPGPSEYSWRIIDVALGAHNLTLSKQGFSNLATNATVKAGEAVIVRGNLLTLKKPLPVIMPSQTPKPALAIQPPKVFYDFNAIDFNFYQKGKYLGSTQIAKIEPNVETIISLTMYAPAVNSPEFPVHFFIDGKKVSEEKLKFYRLAHQLPARIDYLPFLLSKPKFTSGSHILKAIIDPENKIPEAEENNNILEKNIVVK